MTIKQIQNYQNGLFKKCFVDALINGAFQLAGQGIQVGIDKASEKRAEKRQIAAEQRQQDYDIAAEERALKYQKDLMDYENEYNDPKEQMRRMAEAGLNPYLADGVSAGTASDGSGAIGATPASAQASETIAGQYGTGIGAALQSAMAHNLELKKLDLENRRINEQVAQGSHSRMLQTAQFDYQQQRDIIEDTFKQKEYDLKTREMDEKERATRHAELMAEKKQALEEAKHKYERERGAIEDKIKQDENRRAWDMHKIQVEDGQLRNKMSRINFEDMSDNEVRKAKKDLVIIDRNLAKMNETERNEYMKRLDKTMELYDKRTKNQIEEQEFINAVRDTWYGKNKSGTYSGSAVLNGVKDLPYMSSGSSGGDMLGFLADIATFAATKGKVK